MDVHVVFYQEACQNCFHIVIIFKFVAAKIVLQPPKQTIVARRRMPLL